MDFSNLKKNISGAQVQNRVLRWAMAGLIISNLLLAIAALRTQAVVTIQPPGLTERVLIARNEASENYIKGWGLFVAGLLGNTKPGRVDFILETLTPLLAPEIYRPVTIGIKQQAKTIAQDHITTSFTPQRVAYDPKRNIVYVTGRQVSTGPGSDPMGETRTYEMVIQINDYRPLITQITVYAGTPRFKEDD